MPVIRISEEQKSALDEEIEKRFATDVSYRVVLAEVLDEVNDD
jgi:hypothetical protein